MRERLSGVFNVPRTRQTIRGRCARDTFQRFVSLGVRPAAVKLRTGGEVGRHHIFNALLLARKPGPEFRNVNIMAVAHGTDKRLLPRGIRRRLMTSPRLMRFRFSYTNVFLGGRSEISRPRFRHAFITNGCRSRGRVKVCDCFRELFPDT